MFLLQIVSDIIQLMKIHENYPLKKLNAFFSDVSAKYFVKIQSVKDLEDLANNVVLEKGKHYVLGGGSNTLFTKDFDGLVIKIEIKGIKVIKEDKNDVVVEIGAGEDWIKLVDYSLKKGWAGLENLSLIPGTVGAAPVQNIGAYGQSFENVFLSLKAFDLRKGALKTFLKKDCRFGYRNSLFKQSGFKHFVITSVTLKLHKNPHINLGYKSRYDSLIEELKTFAEPPYKITDVSKAVIAIRKRKFPDWKRLGTAGSFFLNPIISKTKLKELQKVAPGVQFYMVDKFTSPTPEELEKSKVEQVKVAAGWLLEELGWKGKKIGHVGTSPNQSLVIIGYPGSTAKEILNFSKKIQKDFLKAYKINLEPEVNII